MKRIITLLLALSLLLCACGEPKTKDYMSFDESSEKTWGNGLSDSDTVMTVNGYDVSYSELRYYMTVLDADKSEIKDRVLPEMLLGRSIAIMAEEHDIALTSDEYENLKDYLKQASEDELYTEQLELAAMTDSLFRFIALHSQLTAKVYEYYTDELTTPVKASDEIILATADNGELIRVKHILVKVDQSTTDNLAKAEANAILQKLLNGESIDDLITAHSDYKSSNEVATGEYIYRYEMPEQFARAAFALEVGETSEVVYVVSEGYVGYHIIQRLPVESSYVEKNLDTLRVNYMASKFYEEAYAGISDMTVEYTDNYNKI